MTCLTLVAQVLIVLMNLFLRSEEALIFAFSKGQWMRRDV